MTARLLRTVFILFFFGLVGVLEATTISCINEDGKAVDWFTFYKLPKSRDKKGNYTGLEYLYLDSTTRSWRMGKQLVNSTKSFLGRTLQQLYKAHACQYNNTAYLIYNDGVPNAVNYSSKYGHTKGLLLWNRVQGFWLLHSIPKFPPVATEGYGYPHSGKRNGQAGICVTFKYSQFKAIDLQLLIYNPNIYSCFIPDTFQQELIHMPQLCAGIKSRKIPRRYLTTLQSSQGQKFLHFAKSSSYLDDIFAAWMAQQLKTHLLAETWQRKNQELPSNCSLLYHVYNIKAIVISEQYDFNSYQDHSKWCVSQNGTQNQWTCIGDINRSPSQAFRSGGFICTQNQHIYKAYQKLVLEYENCN
ncbi:deoxyribonuclease-2-beta [Suncus etruscus]|uniref:deoxyribonuclease-2-beta n=1 Tax=Suncus etruscus TaxID=109475 RepID=UPI00210F48F7|nr:deoxyribonuclease-2-beta [Suncus etruscus]